MISLVASVLFAWLAVACMIGAAGVVIGAIGSLINGDVYRECCKLYRRRQWRKEQQRRKEQRK